jgi:hypothetical protein
MVVGRLLLGLFISDYKANIGLKWGKAKEDEIFHVNPSGSYIVIDITRATRRF